MPRQSKQSGIPGICWDASRCQWRVDIFPEGKRDHVGRFDSLEKAVEAQQSANSGQPMVRKVRKDKKIYDKNAYQRAHRAANIDHYRDKELRNRFGITRDEYNALLAEQGGVCAICDQPETAVRMGHVLPLSVDHNHRTNAIRGLLCSACNIGIGSLAESKERLLKAIAYLDKWDAIENQPLPDNVVQLKKD